MLLDVFFMVKRETLFIFAGSCLEPESQRVSPTDSYLAAVNPLSILAYMKISRDLFQDLNPLTSDCAHVSVPLCCSPKFTHSNVKT